MTAEDENVEDGNPNALLTATEEEDHSSRFYYHCAHGSSNTPCPYHFPENSQVMPDDWYVTYVPTKPPGLTDEMKMG